MRWTPTRSSSRSTQKGTNTKEYSKSLKNRVPADFAGARKDPQVQHLSISQVRRALLEFLKHTTEAGANIAFLDIDDKGTHPDRLTVTLRLEEKEAVESFLEKAKSNYRLEVLEYDPSGEMAIRDDKMG